MDFVKQQTIEVLKSHHVSFSVSAGEVGLADRLTSLGDRCLEQGFWRQLMAQRG